MSDDEWDKAHETYELFQELIISTGVTLLKDLNEEQREYVITKLHDEFRFWRIQTKLTPA